MLRKVFRKGISRLSGVMVLSVLVLAGVVYQVWAEQEKEVTYLSDLTPKKAIVGWRNYTRDQNVNQNGKIAIRERIFEIKIYDKGVGAHADAELVYNLEQPLSLGRDIFESYIGVQAGMGKGKVEFAFYLDEQLVYRSKPLTEVKVQPVIFSIKDKKELKILINSLGDKTQDHSVLAGARFVKKDFQPTKIDTTVADIRKGFNLATATYDRGLREKMLKARFFEKIGLMEYDYFRNLGEKERQFADWLINDIETLGVINEAQEPYGSGVEFLRILARIREEDPVIENDSLQKKIAVATAIAGSGSLKFYWDQSQTVEPVARYKLYRNLARAKGQLAPMFEMLDTASLVNVVSVNVVDEDILWLREKIKAEFPDRAKTTEGISGLNHNYIAYLDKNKFGDSIHGSDFYGQHPDLRRIIERGGVCGTISKFGSMVMNSFGVPAALVGQPGHAAMVYRQDNGDPGRNNWISSWAETSGAIWSPSINKLSEINLWTMGPLAHISSESIKNPNYNAARELYEYSQMFGDEELEKTAILNRVIDMNPLYLPAYVSRIRQIEALGEDKESLMNFGFVIMEKLNRHPAVMMGILDRFESKIVDRKMRSDFIAKYIEAIDKPKTRIEADTMDSDKYRSKIADLRNYLADFRFDGPNGNKFIGGNIATEYSIDGGQNWKAFKEENHQLTKAEVDKITPENGILLRAIGARFPVKIQISREERPKLKINDKENFIIGKNLLDLEYSYDNGRNWIEYSEVRPDLNGEKTILARYKKTGRIQASEAVSLSFTDQNLPDDYSFVPNQNLSVQKVTSDEAKYGEKATNALDDDPGTIWHSNYNRGDRQPAITIKLNKKYPIKAILYQPRQDNGDNGTAKRVRISYSVEESTNENSFTVLEPVVLNYGGNMKKTMEIPVDFKATVVKFEILEGYNNFGSAAEIKIRTTPEEAKKALNKLKSDSEKEPRRRLVGSLYTRRHSLLDEANKTGDMDLKNGLLALAQKIPEEVEVLKQKSFIELSQIAQEVALGKKQLEDLVLIKRYQNLPEQAIPSEDYLAEREKGRIEELKREISQINQNDLRAMATKYYASMGESERVLNGVRAERGQLLMKINRLDKQVIARDWKEDFKGLLEAKDMNLVEKKLGLAEQTFRILPVEVRSLLITEEAKLGELRQRVKQSESNSSKVLEQMIEDSKKYIRDLDNSDLAKIDKLSESLVGAEQILANGNSEAKNQAVYDLMMKKQIAAYQIKERGVVASRRQAFMNLHGAILSKPLAEIGDADKTAIEAARANYIRLGGEAQGELAEELKRLEAIEALVATEVAGREALVKIKTKEVVELNIEKMNYAENRELLWAALDEMLADGGDTVAKNQRLNQKIFELKNKDDQTLKKENDFRYRERAILRQKPEEVAVGEKAKIEGLIAEVAGLEQEEGTILPVKADLVAILDSIKSRESENSTQPNEPGNDGQSQSGDSGGTQSGNDGQSQSGGNDQGQVGDSGSVQPGDSGQSQVGGSGDSQNQQGSGKNNQAGKNYGQGQSNRRDERDNQGLSQGEKNSLEEEPEDNKSKDRKGILKEEPGGVRSGGSSEVRVESDEKIGAGIEWWSGVVVLGGIVVIGGGWWLVVKKRKKNTKL